MYIPDNLRKYIQTLHVARQSICKIYISIPVFCIHNTGRSEILIFLISFVILTLNNIETEFSLENVSSTTANYS